MVVFFNQGRTYLSKNNTRSNNVLPENFRPSIIINAVTSLGHRFATVLSTVYRRNNLTGRLPCEAENGEK